MDNYDRILELFNDLSYSDKVQLNNLFCEQANYMDDYIYSNDEEFFEMFLSNPFRAVQATHYGSYNYTDDYVQFNGYGNLDSADDPEQYMDVDLIIAEIIGSPEVYEDFINLDFLEEE